MRNRDVGFLIIGIFAAVFVVAIFSNSTLKDASSQTCDYSSSCSVPNTITIHTNLALVVAGVVLFIGFFLIFFKNNNVARVFGKRGKVGLNDLSDDERNVVKILKRENGEFLQKDIISEMDMGKVKMTRLINKLESRGIVERRRKGMNNIIVLIG